MGLKVKQFQLSAWRRAAVPNYSRLDGVAEVLLQVLRHREGPDTKIYLLYHKHNRQKIITFSSRLQACYLIRFIQVYMDKKNFIHIFNIRFCNIISAPKIMPWILVTYLIFSLPNTGAISASGVKNWTKYEFTTTEFCELCTFSIYF